MKMISLLIISILFIGCMGNSKTIDEKLVGTWNGYLVDPMSGEKMEKLVIKFTAEGEIIYTTGEGEMQYIINSTYRVKNGIIYSKSLDEKKEEKATYEIKDNKLIMINEGVSNEFLKND